MKECVADGTMVKRCKQRVEREGGAQRSNAFETVNSCCADVEFAAAVCCVSYQLLFSLLIFSLLCAVVNIIVVGVILILVFFFCQN